MGSNDRQVTCGIFRTVAKQRFGNPVLDHARDVTGRHIRQSRFGKERWLEPATDATLQDLAARGVRRVDVVCPGFAVDCLETLEEIAMQNAELFHARGGGELRYLPCLNDDASHADVLAALARRAVGPEA